MAGIHEAAFQALLRGSHDLVLILGRDGRILDAGQTACARLAGGGRLSGTNFLDRLSVNSRRALVELFDALGSDSAITLEHEAPGSAVGDVPARVRYEVHAIPNMLPHKHFLLIGRGVSDADQPARKREPTALDPLTGLANRQGLAVGLARLWADCESEPSRPLAWVLMVDVDRFKALNDRHGHLAGDAALSEIGRVLVMSVREGDLTARYGGDEFLLAGRAGEPDDVKRVATRVVEAVRGLRLRPPGTEGEIRPTVSVGGVVTAPGPKCPARDAIAAADRALYRAKEGGRDRAVVDLQGHGVPRDAP